MKESLFFLKNQIMCAKTPLEILGTRLEQGQGTTNKFHSSVSRPLGVPQLWQILAGAGVMAAVLVIMYHLLKLLIVNYPKTVTQTKQKVAHGLAVIACIASLAAIFDTVLGVTQSALGMSFY